MLPPDFVTSTGHHVKQNIGQSYLWECFLDMVKWATAKPLDAIVIVGDVVEGKQPKSRCAELCLPLMRDQENASKVIFRTLFSAAKCSKIFFVKGTFYHDDEMGRSVDNIAEELKSTAYEGLGVGTYAKEVLDLDVDGCVLDFSHGISVSGGLYRAVAIDREALWSALAGKTGQAPKADVVVRGHAHYFVHIEHPSKHGIILPAWQLQTSYMRKNSRYRMLPDLGAVILEIDGSAKKRNEDPCRVIKRLYPLPTHRLTHL